MNAPTMNPQDFAGVNYANEAAHIDAIKSTLGPRRLAKSALARCLPPLLVALDWFGAPRGLLAHLPGEDQALAAGDLRLLLAANGFSVQKHVWSKWQKNRTLADLPIGSVLLGDTTARVYLGHNSGAHWWHDGDSLIKGGPTTAFDTLLLIETDVDYQSLDAPQVAWLQRLVFAARHEIGGVLFVSFIANLLALVISLFTMFVYNTIIPGGAIGTLWTMTAGAVIAIFGAWGLRLMRVRLLSDLTAWAGTWIGDISMRKTLGLPAEVSARLGVENNLIRLRSLEGVRQWFGGAGGAVNADFPFVFIFLIVIAMLGGWIVLVPILGLTLFALVSWPLARAAKVRSNEVSRVSRKLGEMTTVVTKRLRALRGVRGSALWNRQIPGLVAQSVAANRDYALINGLSQTIGQALAMLTVLATMGAGIALVLSGTMNTGGLIATMMLIWRVTTPAQQMFTNQVRLEQLGDSSKQLDRLLLSVGEASNPQMTAPVTSLAPSLDADRLYYRYSADREPALSGVSFKVEPGQIVAVVGPNGSGKTTLLETLAGVRPVQNGRVVVGGRDIRQFDPTDYRSWLGYLPQEIPGLPITVREALTLRHPASADSELKASLERVAGPQWWTLLGQSSADVALNYSILPWREDREAIRGRFIVRLATATLGDPPLMLLDDPLGDRDPVLDPFFLSLLDSLRGKSTVILSTHRPDLIQRADHIAVLNDGALAHFGPVAPPQAAPQAPVAAPAQA